MKIISVIVLIIRLSSCTAQQHIVPLEQHISFLDSINNSEDDNAQVPENTYYKDVNNSLDPYVGTWTGTYGFTNIEVVVTKVTNSNGDITVDELFIRHRVYNGLGDIVNTLNLPDESPFVMKGIYFNYQGNYLVNYIHNTHCGQDGTVYIKLRENPNQMSFVLLPTGRINQQECPNPDNVSQILPTEYIILTKQ